MLTTGKSSGKRCPQRRPKEAAAANRDQNHRLQTNVIKGEGTSMKTFEESKPKGPLGSVQSQPANSFNERNGGRSRYVSGFLCVVSPRSLLFALSLATAVATEVDYAKAEPPDPPAPDPWAKYEPLRIKGTYMLLPPPAETVDGQAGGLRSALADQGIGYFAYSLNNFTNNTLGGIDRAQNHPQQYLGQKVTYSSQNYLFVTYDLSRFGIPDGQIVAGAVGSTSSWIPGVLDKIGLTTLSYYQTMFDKKVELKFGYLMNSFEFVGNFIAGGLTASVFGPAGNIPFQGGLSTLQNSTPGVNVKWNITDTFYDKIGIQRSSNPDGVVVEAQDNPTSLNFTTPNSGVLYINEFGYRTLATPESSSLWIRSGAAYNTSDYENDQFVGMRSSDNRFFYLLGDAQIWQPTPVKNLAARGLYVGFTAEYAPPDLNTFSQYYELRSYFIGPFASRPSDTVALVLTNSTFSYFLVDNARLVGNLAHLDSKSATISYNARLSAGVYAGLGVSYVDHPTTVTFTTKTGSALNLLSSLTLFF
jgi:porin